MSVIYAFLKEHFVPVVQYDFLMEYLFGDDTGIDYHNADKTFSESDFFGVLKGNGSQNALQAFADNYASRMIPDGGMYAFSIVAYHQFWASLLIARYIRRVNSEAVIVFGGPFITIRPVESFVPYGMADFWVKGSGEIPLLMLHRLHQEKIEIPRGEIPGVIYFDGGGLVQAPQSRLPAEDERVPDFEGLSLGSYRYDHPLTGEKTLFPSVSHVKGCVFPGVTYGTLVDRYDCKSADKIVSELSELARNYQTPTFQFADASINGNPDRLAQVCDRLAANFPEIRWYAYAKVNGFSPALLKKAKKAGCFSLFWGVESAHPPTVRLLGKSFDTTKMYDLIDESISLGIKNYVHLIYNAPHESEGDVESLIRLMERFSDSTGMFLPQRFLLEPVLDSASETLAATNLRSVGTSVFEREQFVYDELDGLESEKIRERNEHYRKRLEAHLDRIRYSNLINGAGSALLRRIPPKLLVESQKRARTSRLVEAARTFVAADRRIQRESSFEVEHLESLYQFPPCKGGGRGF
jgi:hypothetical protein